VDSAAAVGRLSPECVDAPGSMKVAEPGSVPGSLAHYGVHALHRSVEQRCHLGCRIIGGQAPHKEAKIECRFPLSWLTDRRPLLPGIA